MISLSLGAEPERISDLLKVLQLIGEGCVFQIQIQLIPKLIESRDTLIGKALGADGGEGRGLGSLCRGQPVLDSC